MVWFFWFMVFGFLMGFWFFGSYDLLSTTCPDGKNKQFFYLTLPGVVKILTKCWGGVNNLLINHLQKIHNFFQKGIAIGVFVW